MVSNDVNDIVAYFEARLAREAQIRRATPKNARVQIETRHLALQSPLNAQAAVFKPSVVDSCTDFVLGPAPGKLPAQNGIAKKQIRSNDFASKSKLDANAPAFTPKIS